jgi:hypothetical protein
MLRQLLREQEVGFPTPEDEAVDWESIVWTMREHLTYLALTINFDPRCPAPCCTGPFYPLGENRMSDEEFKQRRDPSKGSVWEYHPMEVQPPPVSDDHLLDT